MIKLSRVGNVMLTVMAKRHEQDVTLTEFGLARELSKNVMSYGKLDREGFGLRYSGVTCALARRSNGEVIFDIKMEIVCSTLRRWIDQATQERQATY